jgi:alkylation response protein AidB-like acyl-CoA dehydrogenase
MELLGDEIFTASDRAVAATDLFLRNRCLSIAGGTTQILRNVAGERILGLPRG